MNNLIFASASELTKRIRAREISAVEVVKMHLARIDEINPSLNAVVTRCDDMALERAREADAALARDKTLGPLHGLPITIKDAFETAGVRSTGGTKGRADYIPSTNAADLSLSPGGSSGGSAAIVAAGGSPLDLGSDTGGSIRLPAHFCGVAGIKPTAGRVPRTGLIIPGGVPVDPLTQVGPIARFVEDLELVLPIISGVDWEDCSVVPMPLGEPRAVRIEDLHIAFYTDNGDVAASPEVGAVVRDCARVVGEQGAKVTEACPPVLEQSQALMGRIFRTDGGAWIRRILERLGTKEFYPSFKWTDKRDDAPEATAGAFTAVLEEWDQFRRGMLGFLRDHEVILAPVHAYTALPPGELRSKDRHSAFSYSQTYNLTGWPSVVVRAGTSEQGLPIGVQVVARPWQDHVALAVARRIEESLGGWRPPPQAR